MRLRAIVVRRGGENDIVKRASLLRRDSIHGPFDGTIVVDEDRNVITANGTEIQVIYSNDPTTVDYTAHGIKDALVIAEKKAGGGKAYEAEVEREGASVQYDIKVALPDREQKVKVGPDGKVVD